MNSSASAPNPDDEAGHNGASPLAEYVDDDDVDDDFPASKKRPRVTSCASSAAVPASVRRRVIASANSRCWLCSQHGKHVAHVIARSDRILVSPPTRPALLSKPDTIQFDEFRSTGLLHMASLHSFENLVYLCHGCHGAFDERIPAWAFLPTTLPSFLTAELAFHAARAAAAASGTRLLRPAPDGNPPPLLYTRYQIRRGHVFTQVFRKKPTRLWAGNPVAAIIRSASVLMGVQRLDPVARCGIPDDVGEILQRLLWLYATPPPKVVSVVPGVIGRPEDDDDEEDDSLGEEEDDDDDDQHAGSGVDELPERPQEEKRQSTRGSNRGQQNHRKHHLTPPCSQQRQSKKLRCVVPGEDQDEAEWVFGPMVTANRMVDWFCATRDCA